GGPPPSAGGLGLARSTRGGDRRPLTQSTEAPGQNGRGHVSPTLWLPDVLRTVSRARLGQTLALTPAGGLAQTLLAEAVATHGAGGGQRLLYLYLSRWATGQRKRPDPG